MMWDFGTGYCRGEDVREFIKEGNSRKNKRKRLFYGIFSFFYAIFLGFQNFLIFEDLSLNPK